MAQVIFPAFRPVTFKLTVTDEAGRIDSTSVTINSSLTSPDSTSGSGGGAFGSGSLICLLALLMLPAWNLAVRRNRN